MTSRGGAFYQGENVTLVARDFAVWRVTDYAKNVVAEGMDFDIDLGSELPVGYYEVWNRDDIDAIEPETRFAVLRPPTPGGGEA